MYYFLILPKKEFSTTYTYSVNCIHCNFFIMQNTKKEYYGFFPK